MSTRQRVGDPPPTTPLTPTTIIPTTTATNFTTTPTLTPFDHAANSGKNIIRILLTIVLFPFAIFLSVCSVLLAFLKSYFFIYQDIPASTTSERETAFIQSQAHLQDGPNRIKRRTWHCASTGSLSNLVCREEYLDLPIPGYVQVKVHAIGLNFADIFAVQGLYSATPPFGFTPGLEFSGEIIAIPANATLAQRSVDGHALQVGDRVHGVTRFGAYSTIVNANVWCIKPLPKGWTYMDGASNLVQALTAAYGLFTIGGLSSKSLAPEDIDFYLYGKKNNNNNTTNNGSLTLTNTNSTYSAQEVPQPTAATTPPPPIQHPSYLPHQKEVSPGFFIPQKRPIVLIHSAAGGVGLHALTMCLKTGAIPICTVSGHRKRVYLVNRYKLLPEQVIDRNLCGYLQVKHIPSPPKHDVLSHVKYYAKSFLRRVFAPVRSVIDKTIFFRRKQSKDYSFLLDYALKKIGKVLNAMAKSGGGCANNNTNNTSTNSTPCMTPVNMLSNNASNFIPEYYPILDEPTKTNNNLQQQLLTIDVALDSLLGNYFHPTLQHMGCNNSKMLIFGAASYSTSGDFPDFIHLCNEYFRRPMVDPMEMIPLNSGIVGFNLIWLWDQLAELHGLLHILKMLLPFPIINITCFGTSKENSPDAVQSALKQQQDLVASGEVVQTVFDQRDEGTAVNFLKQGEDGFKHLPEALKTLQTGQHIGKLVVSVSHD